MSDWTKFDITNDDLDDWGQGIILCPIQAALEHATIDWMTFNETTQRWQRQGRPSEVFTKPFRGLVQMDDQLYQLCESGRRFQRHIRESESLCTSEELIKFGLIFPTRLWIRWNGESDYSKEWLRKCQLYQRSESKPVSIPKVTEKPLETDDRFDLMRERRML